MKLKLLFFLPIILLLALFLSFFPRLYFNELEYKGREKFSSIEEAKQIADDHIEQRSGRQGGTKNYLETTNLSIDIAADLGKVSFLMDEHELILKKQNKISFLLPSKYREFLKLKNEVFNKYYSSLRKFKSLKDYESAIINLFYTKDRFTSGMRESATWEELDELVKKLVGFRDSIKQYFDEGFMTKEFYEASLASINANVELYNLLIEATNNDYSSEVVSKKIKEIGDKYSDKGDVYLTFQNSYYKITTVKQDEWSNLFNGANELSYGALEYYEENKLAYDPISVLISKFNKSYPKNTALINDGSNTEEQMVDLDGDGKDEVLRLTYSSNEETYPETESLVAYDLEGNEVARYPEDLPMAVPMSESSKVYNLDKSSKKQFVSYDFIAGPHSADTMFIGLSEKNGEKVLLPVCFVEFPKSALECLFWASEINSLEVNDFDEDRMMEVVEMVDEYPKDGPITSEVEEMIEEQFADLGQLAIDGMTRIAKREQGGRGNRVIWGIYSFNGKYFEKHSGVNYDKYYNLISEYLKGVNNNYPTIMKINELSKESLEYNKFMRGFWTDRNYI